jgi:MFS transporter, PAT family, beta-lactamase induction signal transducer AmpG
VTAAPERAAARPAYLDALAVYLKPRVLTIFFLGFSSGLPYALTGSTLQAWLTQSGVDIGVIGLFAGVGIPYLLKFLWAPLVDALDVPILSALLGRRRGWLLLTQILLMASVLLMGFCSPALSLAAAAIAGVLVAASSATQDIVIDAFRVESLPEDEQAAGQACYVAAYRVGLLISGAGTLILVSGLEGLDYARQTAWSISYASMGLLVAVGIVTTLLAVEPVKSANAAAEHAAHARESPLRRVAVTTFNAFADFLTRDAALGALAFVVLFKLADALGTALNTTFLLQTGFTNVEIAAITKFVGFIALLVGGFAGGFVARAYPLGPSLWIGGILQTVTILTFSWQALVGKNLTLLTFAITAENFTGAIGTVIFVAYLSALCGNPLHTATQYALLTALTALGSKVFALGAGYLVLATGWFWYFIVCAALAIPSFVLLAYLQRRGHFARLAATRL